MKVTIGIALAAMPVTSAGAQDSPFRKELKRSDLTGMNMEVITSISELKPGDTSTLHIHPGDESYYFLEGGTTSIRRGIHPLDVHDRFGFDADGASQQSTSLIEQWLLCYALMSRLHGTFIFNCF